MAATWLRKGLNGCSGYFQAIGSLCLHYISVYLSLWLSNGMTLPFVNDLYPNSQIELRHHTYNTNTALKTLPTQCWIQTMSGIRSSNHHSSVGKHGFHQFTPLKPHSPTFFAPTHACLTVSSFAFRAERCIIVSLRQHEFAPMPPSRNTQSIWHSDWADSWVTVRLWVRLAVCLHCWASWFWLDRYRETVLVSCLTGNVSCWDFTEQGAIFDDTS